MTDERKNEIWAFLTPGEKSNYSKEYNASTEDDWDRGYEAALQSIFGKHNLTAQAEEKPKEKSKIGNSDKSIIDYQQYRLAKEIAVAMITNSYRNGIITNDEILSHDIVRFTNEIVKRLKETE